jgi:hypothetical protein
VKSLPQQARTIPQQVSEPLQWYVVGHEGTTALLYGWAVGVDQQHRHWAPADYVLGASESDAREPVVLTVSAPITLSVEDVAAVLFSWGLPYEDLADDHIVRSLVADTVVNRGCCQIEEARACLGEHPTLTEHDIAYLAYCRQRAATVFSMATCRGVR